MEIVSSKINLFFSLYNVQILTQNNTKSLKNANNTEL